MLGQLHIQNIGIIDDLTIDFEEALNIITGETGAGKSLIIDSVEAITGGRTSKEIIRTGEEKAFIEAYFFNSEEEYVLSREIHQNGKNICKINGSLVTVTELRKLGEKLIDLHGQHDNQKLLDTTTHIELLDAFSNAQLQEKMDEYKQVLAEYKEVSSKIKNTFGDDQQRARKIDLLEFQIDEIQGAYLNQGEEEDLLSKHKLMQNAEKIAHRLNSSHELLSSNILNELSEVTKAMGAISSIDDKYSLVFQQINDSYYNLQDAVDTIADYAMELDFDQNMQNEVEERLDVISSLKRKYGNSIEEILQYLDKITEEKDFLQNSEEIIQKLSIEQSKLQTRLMSISKKITDIRKSQALKIETKVNKELQDLEMKKAYISFEFTHSEEFLDNGQDIVQILICTNVGDDLKPLCKIASGGELSRVMLALKTVLGEYDSVPTMIFDEIDTGISGEAGKAVAEKLKLISKLHQVICVTHLPTIVASGYANYYIDKRVRNGKTITSMKKLTESETIQEIARVIAGNDLTKAVITHATELRNLLKIA